VLFEKNLEMNFRLLLWYKALKVSGIYNALVNKDSEDSTYSLQEIKKKKQSNSGKK
jgi:hypothetical protein